MKEDYDIDIDTGSQPEAVNIIEPPLHNDFPGPSIFSFKRWCHPPYKLIPSLAITAVVYVGVAVGVGAYMARTPIQSAEDQRAFLVAKLNEKVEPIEIRMEPSVEFSTEEVFLKTVEKPVAAPPVVTLPSVSEYLEERIARSKIPDKYKSLVREHMRNLDLDGKSAEEQMNDLEKYVQWYKRLEKNPNNDLEGAHQEVREMLGVEDREYDVVGEYQDNFDLATDPDSVIPRRYEFFQKEVKKPNGEIVLEDWVWVIFVDDKGRAIKRAKRVSEMGNIEWAAAGAVDSMEDWGLTPLLETGYGGAIKVLEAKEKLEERIKKDGWRGLLPWN